MTKKEKDMLKLVLAMTTDCVLGKITLSTWLQNMKMYLDDWDEFVK
jgi:hypothetical protein